MKVPDPGNIPSRPEPPRPGAEPGPPKLAQRLLDQLGARQGETLLAKVLRATGTVAPQTGPAGAGSPGTASTRGGAQLVLEIMGRSLPVEADLPLETGTRLRVQREQNHLRLLEVMAPPRQQKAAAELGQQINRQVPLNAGLQQLASLARSLPDLSAGSLSAPLRKAVADVMQQLPPQNRLIEPASRQTPAETARIRDWVVRSGGFTESRLTQSQTPAQAREVLNTDLKASLVRLAGALLPDPALKPEQAAQQLRQVTAPPTDPNLGSPLQFPQFTVPAVASGSRGGETQNLTTGEALRLLAGLINRLNANQLHSLVLSTPASADAPPPPQTWLLELPWLGLGQQPQTAQVRIERHGLEREKEETREEEKNRKAQWRLALSLDLEKLGPVHFELALSYPGLQTQVWAKHRETLRLVEAETPRLRDGLTALGLEVGPIRCHLGQPSRQATRLQHRLVDERA